MKKFNLMVCGALMSIATFAQPIGEWKVITSIGSTQGQSYPSIEKLVEFNNQLYMFGNFNKLGTDTTYNGVARITSDRTISEVAGGVLLANGKAGLVQDAIVFNGALYIGGEFTKAGTTDATGFAKWDGTSWSKVDGVFETYDELSFTIHDGTIYMAKKKKLFKLNGNAFEEVLTTNVDIKGIASWNNRLFLAGGSFKLKDNTNAFVVVEVINAELVKLADFVHLVAGQNAASSSAIVATQNGLVFNGLVSTINGDTLNKALYIYNGTSIKHVGGGTVQAPGGLVYHQASNRLLVHRVNRAAFEENGDYVDGNFNLCRDMTSNKWLPMSASGKRQADYQGMLGDQVFGCGVYLGELMYYSETFPTSIKNVLNTSQKIQCYPNPSNGVFNFTPIQKMVSCNVYDAAGRLCNNYQWSNNSIDLTGLESGMYYIHLLDTKGNAYTSKVQLSL